MHAHSQLRLGVVYKLALYEAGRSAGLRQEFFEMEQRVRQYLKSCVKVQGEPHVTIHPTFDGRFCTFMQLFSCSYLLVGS